MLAPDTEPGTIGRMLRNRNQTPAISPDGDFVVFTSMAAGAGEGEVVGTSDVFVVDRRRGTPELVSAGHSGAPGDADSFGPSISTGGTHIAFTSNATGLISRDVTAGFNVFVRDRERGVTELVSVSDAGVPGDRMSFRASISADGRYVSFASAASNLAAGCPGGIWQIFVRDRERGVTELISSGSDGQAGDRPSAGSALSADGRYVVFHSGASNLLPGRPVNGGGIFLRDRELGTTELVSVGPDGSPAPGCAGWAISADGAVVAFASQAGLVAGVPAGSWQIYARDRERGVTELVSAGPGGAAADGDCAADSVGVGISETGRFVCFTSAATNLAEGDSGDMSVFVRDRAGQSTGRIGLDRTGLLPPPSRPARVAAEATGTGWTVLQDSPHGRALAAPPGIAGKSQLFTSGPAAPASAAASAAGQERRLRHDRQLEAHASEQVTVGGGTGEITASGQAHLEVPYFSRSLARFRRTRSHAAWLGESPVSADKIVHTDHWQVDASPPAQVTGDIPAGAQSDGAGGLVWQTEVLDNWLSVHTWDELEFQTKGRLFRSRYTVTGSFQFGSAFFVVCGEASAST